MTSSNRASKYESLYKSLKKHFKPVGDAPERSVLEHLLYACCLEDARYEQADEAFAKLQQSYFDWNEVRVTTIAELGEALHSLPFPAQAGTRIKQCLQSLFESRYQYDIDDLKKANLGKAIAELEAWKGMSPFIVSYVSQHALGGHSIPVSNVILDAMVQCEIITSAEADKRSVPGIERAIPKNKGVEFASLLHQFAIELHLHPKSGAAPLVLKDLGVAYKPKAKVSETKAVPEKKATGKTIAASQPTSASATAAAQKKAEAEKETASKQTKGTEAKPAAPKKGVPAPIPAKETPAKKDATTKGVAPKGEKKAEVGKAAPAPSKKKPSPPAGKPSASKGKPESKPATKKGAGAGKPTSGSTSVASSITKKKPK